MIAPSFIGKGRKTLKLDLGQMLGKATGVDTRKQEF